jgi:hypothetical protein
MGREITWTDKQKQVRAMLEQGATTKDVLAAGHSKATLSRVRDALEKERKQAEAERKPSPQVDAGTKIRARTLDAIEIGALIIEPADWRINQYGAFLILTTYEIAKQQHGYEGTVGEFICDSIQVLRQIMGLEMMAFEYLVKEGGNGREEDQGTNVSPETRQELVGRAAPVT